MTKSADRTAAAERSRWLAEVAEAVAQAQRLARAWGAPDGKCAPAKGLYGRLELVRIEVEALRRGSWGTRPAEFDPQWINLSPWNGHRKD